MSEEIRIDRSPVCSAVSVFLGSTVVLMLIATGLSSGLLSEEFGRRGMYVVLGVLMVLIGNALPKLRPFARWRAEARRAEFFVGGTIMIAGVTWILDFALVPSGWASWIAAGASTVALLIITGSLARVLYRVLSHRGRASDSTVKLDRRARLTFWLLATFVYLLIVATAKLVGPTFHFDPSPAASWGFGIVYAALFVVLERRGGR
jgi:hypothetical protein